MTTLDDEIVPEVVAAIAEVGIPATLTAKATTLTPSTGAVSGGGSTYSIKVTPPAPYDATLVDGVGIQAGDVQLYCFGPDSIGTTPLPGWRISVAGKSLLIESVGELRSGDSIAAFELQCRR